MGTATCSVCILYSDVAYLVLVLSPSCLAEQQVVINLGSNWLPSEYVVYRIHLIGNSAV